jgi:hypothetical protein
MVFKPHKPAVHRTARQKFSYYSNIYGRDPQKSTQNAALAPRQLLRVHSDSLSVTSQVSGFECQPFGGQFQAHDSQ